MTNKMQREIVISDIHGCLEELDELLKLLQYKSSSDKLVFAGDLVDRGPNSVGVIRRVKELGVVCVQGNHDEWYVRFARHKLKFLADGTPNPMKPSAAKISLMLNMTVNDFDWLSRMPTFYRLDKKTVVIHAGMSPGIPVEKQPLRNLIRMRYLRRSNGQMWNMASDELLTPDVAAFWTEVWTGPDEVIYGHHPSQTETVVTENNGVRCWGIDTGCCFGNKLTAWVRVDGKIELVSVKAKAQYAAWHKSMSEA